MVEAGVITGPHFDGETYSPARDHSRLTGQLRRVFDVMKDGQWRTLTDLAHEAEGSEAGVSARLRDLRKPRFLGAEVDRRSTPARGLFEYRLVLRG